MRADDDALAEDVVLIPTLVSTAPLFLLPPVASRHDAELSLADARSTYRLHELVTKALAAYQQQLFGNGVALCEAPHQVGGCAYRFR